MKPEVHRQLNFLAACPAGHTTMKHEDLQDLLLSTGGNMLACGRLYDFVTEHLGAGVYRVSLRLTHP
jgi:hypothetical protein